MSSQRFDVLDYLRGFFIFVIIIDHAFRWPSLFSLVTGQGGLWVTAAEGFVIISGFLVGFIRGNKDSKKPLGSVTKKLLKRAALLYFWFVISTLIYVAASWYIPTLGSTPWIEIPPFNWQELFISTATFAYSYTWVHFLYLYAIFLLVSPVAILLLRRRLSWLLGLLSLTGYIVGLYFGIHWLQWQIMFFLPVIAGFHFPNLRSYWLSIKPERRKKSIIALGIVSFATLIASITAVFLIPENGVSIWLHATLFSKDPVGPGVVILSLIWFVALVALFQRSLPLLKKWLGWLLVPFGTRSLTAYIIHGAAILPLAFLFPMGDSILLNTLLGAATVMITWGMIKVPLIQHIIPR